MFSSRITRVLHALWLALAVIGVQVVFSSVASAAVNGVTVTGTPKVGSTLAVDSRFSVNRSGNYVVDTEMYNASGTKVRQWYGDSYIDSAGATKRYTLDTAGLPAGTYKFKQGIFKSSWAGQVSWNASAGSVTLTSGTTAWDLSATATATATDAVDLSSNFTPPSTFAAASVVLDTEIVDANGTKVAQWADNVAATPGQKIARQYNWNANGRTGNFNVRQGVFSADWSKSFAWKDQSAQVSVDTAPASTTSTTVPTTVAPATVVPTTVAVKAPVQAVQDVVTVATGTNPFTETSVYANPYSAAANQANALRNYNVGDAALMDRIAKGGAAIWIGNWNSNVQGDVSSVVSAAASQNQIPVFVAYNIPGRDCGSYSAGGANGSEAYKSWIRSLAAGIAGRKAAVVLEPDALAQLDCLSSTGQADRLSLLSDAVDVLNAQGKTSVYLDAGHPGWVSAASMANRLKSAGVAKARGFSLNVSNFETTSSNVTYGEQVSALTGGSRYVVDTSRNGNGSKGEWCNPTGRALGAYPTSNTNAAHADAFVWVKQPGESDGTCNGGPSAGNFWADYALRLAKAAA